MLYAIVGGDLPEIVKLRVSTRPAHVSQLKQLHDKGRLVLAGPFPAIEGEDPGSAGFRDSLIVEGFTDFEMASDWVTKNPFVATCVYKAIEVSPFKKVLP